jgi:hypothetical protein
MHNSSTHYSPMLYADMHAERKIMHMHKPPGKRPRDAEMPATQTKVSTDHCQAASMPAVHNRGGCIIPQPIAAQCFTPNASPHKNKCICIIRLAKCRLLAQVPRKLSPLAARVRLTARWQTGLTDVSFRNCLCRWCWRLGRPNNRL